MNWDDLRVAAAVYETGSYAAAGSRLRINETTVARRLSRLEQDLGVRLFEAVDGLRQPTAACRDLVALTATMSDRAEAISRLKQGGTRDVGLAARRRIATTDSIAAELLAPRLPEFLTAHPAMSIDFLASTQNVNFSRWEADLAVRLSKPDKGDFVISKVAALPLYFLEPSQAPSEGHDLVCSFPADLEGTPESQYLAQLGVGNRLRCTTKNFLVARTLIRTRRCAGVLPAFLCADLLEEPSLRVSRLPKDRDAWLLVQPHLKDDPATRAVIDWIKSCFEDYR